MSCKKLQPSALQISEEPIAADIRSMAKKALSQMLEPLAGFVLDSGLSAVELHAAFREAAVKSAAARQLQISNRVNISGISATTGISRAQVSRVLKGAVKPPKRRFDNQQQSTNRILTAWHQDPRFTTSSGDPAELGLYGKGPTFEALTRKYGRGIPPRAVLDELIRAGAVEVLQNQKIRAIASVAVDRGVSVRYIKIFGDLASELLSTMLVNMREPGAARFIANVSDTRIPNFSLPIFRKELSNKGFDFLTDVQESLREKAALKNSKQKIDGYATVSVTIFCHESPNTVKGQVLHRRKNFRREF